MSEKRDLGVPALLALAGLAVGGWDVATGDVLRGVLAILLGLGAAGICLLLLLRHGPWRATAFAVAGFLALAILAPTWRGELRTLLPWALAAVALSVLPRHLSETVRALLLGLAAVLTIVAALAALHFLPARILAFAAVGAFVAASAVWSTRPRPDAGPPPGPRVAVFGGTFDPFHRAHRAISEATLKIADRLLVVVAGQPPHKREGREPTPFHHRVAMARLGVEGLPRTEVLEVEGRRVGPSYTVDTLEGLRKTFPPGTRFLLVLGADSFQDLPLWHDWEGILERATLLVAARPGYDLDPPPELEGRGAPVERLEVAPIEVSSSDCRRRLGAGKDVGERVSPSVAAYVRDHGLYRSDAAPTEPAPDAEAPHARP